MQDDDVAFSAEHLAPALALLESVGRLAGIRIRRISLGLVGCYRGGGNGAVNGSVSLSG
jgi:hypothetical protein